MQDWQGRHEERVVLQTCAKVVGTECEADHTLSAEQYQAFLEEARVVISHAGIGSVISARRARTPIILVPRQVRLQEHRNDHQMATATALDGRKGIRIAWDVDQISDLLDQQFEVSSVEKNYRQNQLVDRIRQFVVN
ncbi:MAG: glycosyltransferase [Litoreibacter sp.]|uniref:glycosyltransferase n=1 Tax=Litoreibacter sp. TaxID=1969459 RepID=UPI00329A36AA